MTLEELVKPIYSASHDVIEAVRTLVQLTEKLEEEILRGKLPEVELSEKELKDLDDSLREMREGAAISLEEFNKKRGP